MTDWYKTMSDMSRGNDGPVVSELKITSRVLKVIVALFFIIFFVHAIRLWSGSVSWFGIEEREVRAAPAWAHTPVSTNLLSSGFGLTLPVFALEGQEIIIQYKLSSAQQNIESPYARVLVSCFCPVEYYGHFRIRGPGNGEFTMPVKRNGLYVVQMGQSSGPKGEVSIGSYYWGIRSGK